MNTRFLEALKGTNKGRPPVWLMRQSGRYLPEYRALRSRHSFDEMIHRPELIVEATSIPLRRYPLDAAILFSD
ncbi:MAG: uroporphyrinogen decarboxylase, partial [Chlamydiia bacterium]|nr:uroporphyrinogen decarboxylase [Chlamydiia bacterium]